MACESAFVSPVVAELNLFVNGTVGVIFFDGVFHEIPSLVLLFHAYVTGAHARRHVVSANLVKRGFVVVQHDFLSAGRGTVTVSVHNDQCAVVFYKAGKVGVVDFAADEHYSCAELALRVGFSGFEFFERFAELVDNEVFRANVGHKSQNVELIPRNRRIGKFSHFADFGENAANFVVLGNGFSDCRVRNVYAVSFVQRRENFHFELLFEVRHRAFVHLAGNVHVTDEKLVVFDQFLDFDVPMQRFICAQASTPASASRKL